MIQHMYILMAPINWYKIILLCPRAAAAERRAPLRNEGTWWINVGHKTQSFTSIRNV